MRMNTIQCGLKYFGTAIGVGIIAGFAGTVAITACQMVEMKITGRRSGVGPANAVEKTMDIKPKPGTKKKFSWEIHWVYGTLWGVLRGLLGFTGMNKWAANTAHFAAITGTAMAIARLEGQKPVTEWNTKEVAIDLLHHAVYAVATGAVFDAIFNDND